MKLFGKILAGILVLVVAGFAIYGVGILAGMSNKNSNKNLTLSIAEARELVDKACTACGVKTNSVSTASLKTQSDTDNTENNYNVNLSSVKQLLAIGKFLVEQSDKNETFYKTTKSAIPGIENCYFACRLKNKGVEVVWTWGSSESMIGGKLVIDIHYLNDDKKNWEIICFSGEANGELENIDDRECNNLSVCPGNVKGVDSRLLNLSWVELELNQSIYGSDVNASSVNSCVYTVIDYVNHENDCAKVYGDYESRTFNCDVQNLTNEELNQFVQSAHESAVNAYSPKFFGVECKEYDVMKDVANALGYNY